VVLGSDEFCAIDNFSAHKLFLRTGKRKQARKYPNKALAFLLGVNCQKKRHMPEKLQERNLLTNKGDCCFLDNFRLNAAPAQRSKA